MKYSKQVSNADTSQCFRGEIYDKSLLKGLTPKEKAEKEREIRENIVFSRMIIENAKAYNSKNGK